LHAAGVNTTDTRDESGAERWHPFTPHAQVRLVVLLPMHSQNPKIQLDARNTQHIEYADEIAIFTIS
jgi:hypothetical protein